MTLLELCESLDRIFSRRERLFFPNPSQKLTLLNVAAGDLQDLIRRQPAIIGSPIITDAESDIDMALRRLFVRWRMLVTHFAVPIGHLMAEKFPTDGCGYCGQLPCVCLATRRPDHRGPRSAALERLDQSSWSTSEWQAHLHRLYGRNEMNHNPPYMVGQLFKEIAEVDIAMDQASDPEAGIDVVYREIGLELADVLAWIFAFANYHSCELGLRVANHYKDGCPHCHRPVCSCRRRRISQTRWQPPNIRRESLMP